MGPISVYTLRIEPQSPIRASNCKNGLAQIKFDLPRFPRIF